MNLNETLDLLLIPRPNGSENLAKIADSLAGILSRNGAAVTEQAFVATPHGFQLMWLFAMLVMGLYSWALFSRRYTLALLLPVLLATVLVLEFEHLVSTISLLWPATERNIIGTWPGAPDGRTIIFTAHYDTTTHYGDHFSWGFWGKLQGPATGIAIALPLAALYLRRRQQPLPVWIAAGGTALATLPFAAMFWFQSVGPLVRTPSVGAIDNGGSVAALVALSEQLKSRDSHSPVTVKIVFLASEEERTLGSWAYAKELQQEYVGRLDKLRVINLESIATTDKLACITEDGFATRRFNSSPDIIHWTNLHANAALGYELATKPLPFGTLTDGRSFLAHGIDAITLRSLESDEFPHNLHSEYDSRNRLSLKGIENAVALLENMLQP